MHYLFSSAVLCNCELYFAALMVVQCFWLLRLVVHKIQLLPPEFMVAILHGIIYFRRDGLLHNGNQVLVTVRAFICDVPARTLLKCIYLQTSYCNCEQCIAKGHWCNRVVLNSVDKLTQLRGQS